MAGGGIYSRGMCVAGGHAWQESVCSRGASVAGGGHLWQGVCVAGGMRTTEQND